ncbi:MAG: hypothetical protein ACE5D0_03635 [Fidelibacterota bacterium]
MSDRKDSEGTYLYDGDWEGEEILDELILNIQCSECGWENILNNKLTALFRSEPKDVADIWMIAKNQSFNWKNCFSG